MTGTKPQYISASRRNDFPRFHYNRFYEALQQGAITYDGGYGRSYTVSLKREDVLGYLFWSKDFKPFITHAAFDRFFEENNALFHFTINDMPALEPHVPSLKDRFKTLELLCKRVTPERVCWRFDPVCKYVSNDGNVMLNVAPFFNMLSRIRQLGVTRCYFSFITAYAKLNKRNTTFLSFTDDEKTTIACEMLDAANQHDISLYNCCNPEILSMVPGIKKASCVDEKLLRHTDRFERHVALRSKPTRQGCGCYESRDIGSYSPACPHGCMYCYANPA
ncbi:MAG: DUF1848 family protein [Fibrobacterota bacterium]